MDIATGVGLIAGMLVVVTLILMGGDLRMFYDVHAIIIIFGGSFAATLIRFPLAAWSKIRLLASSDKPTRDGR
jgi:chemotaxis protein MotA